MIIEDKKNKIEMIIKDRSIKIIYNFNNKEKEKIYIDQGIIIDGLVIKADKLLNIIKNKIKTKKIKNKTSLIINIDSNKSKYFNLDIPPQNSKKDIKELLNLETNAKKYYSNYYIYKDKKENSKKLFVVSIPKNIVNDYLKVFAKLCENKLSNKKIKLKKIQHKTFRNLKTFLNLENKESKEKIIYISDYKALVFVFGKDLNFSRIIDVNIKKIKNELDLEKLINKIYRTLDYYEVNYNNNLDELTLVNKTDKNVFEDLKLKTGLDINLKN